MVFLPEVTRSSRRTHGAGPRAPSLMRIPKRSRFLTKSGCISTTKPLFRLSAQAILGSHLLRTDCDKRMATADNSKVFFAGHATAAK